ncbi:MAG: hypothetical protein CFE22_04940 [Cytophagaceae bacterium BCCC1]|nr:MAG: hypothetical protein CFE22_04940 [Cytophagaceae bacterium BCCC1]
MLNKDQTFYEKLQHAESSFTFQKLPAGIYEFAVKDKNGCQLNLVDEIVDAVKLNNKINLGGELRTADSVVVCKGQVITLDAKNPGQLIEWYKDGKILETFGDENRIEIDEQGIYAVLVKNLSGCSSQDNFHFKFNQFALKTDFLFPTQAFVGDTVVCLDITKPIPDRVVWEYPNEFKMITKNYSKLSLAAASSGFYEIQMTAYSNSCSNKVKHKIEIKESIEKPANIFHDKITYFEIFPNPNNGKFRFEITSMVNDNFEVDMINTANSKNVYTKTFEQQNKISQEVDLKLVPGIYILYVKTGTEVLSKRILIL